MRISSILVVSLLGLPLGGCFGVKLPTQPLPDWAMNAQYDEPRADQARGTSRKKQRVARQRLPGDFTTVENALVTGGTGSAQSAARVVDTKPFAPGWDTPEAERDESLRRTLSICRGC